MLEQIWAAVAQHAFRSSGLRSRSLHSRSTPAEQHAGTQRCADMVYSS